MTHLCDDLAASVTRIVGLWDDALMREPWILPRQHARPDFVPDLVTAIAAATVCSPPTRDSVLALTQAAARHAAGRAAEGAEQGRVVLEYYLLRNAIWAWLGERHLAAEADLRTILYVDVAISVATRAALLGYHQREFEAQGTWGGALDRLVDDVPLLWEADPRNVARPPTGAGSPAPPPRPRDR